MGSFVLSKGVAKHLEELDNSLTGLEYEAGPPWEYFEMSADLYTAAIPTIRDAAKVDLDVA